MIDYWNLMDMFRPLVNKAIGFVMGDMMRDLDQLDSMESPRVLKTHLPLYLLNPTILNTSKESAGTQIQTCFFLIHHLFPSLQK